MKLDHNVSTALRLTGRYFLADRGRSSRSPAPASRRFPASATTSRAAARTGRGRDVRHRPAVNDLRLGYNRVSIGVFPEDTSITNSSVGLPTLSSNPRDAGLGLIQHRRVLAGRHEYNNPQESTATTIQIADTATAAFGAHLFKAGAEWYGVRQSAYRTCRRGDS